MPSEPAENLLPKGLPNINNYVLVFVASRTIINQQRSIAPVDENDHKV